MSILAPVPVHVHIMPAAACHIGALCCTSRKETGKSALVGTIYWVRNSAVATSAGLHTWCRYAITGIHREDMYQSFANAVSISIPVLSVKSHLAIEGCNAGSCGQPDMYAERLCQKDRSAMALTLQAQTLADAAKVIPRPAVFLSHAVFSCSVYYSHT